MTRIVDKREKSKVISDAALKVFREVGYHGTRMADIAQAAGIGKGTLYEYFRDKADILRFAFEQYFSIFAKGVFEAINDKSSPSEKLLSLADFVLQHAGEWEDHCAIYVDYFGVAGTDKDGQFSLSPFYDQMKNILVGLIKESQATGEIDTEFEPVVVAELLVSVFDGIILHRIFEGHGADRQFLLQATLRFIKNGLLIRSDNPETESKIKE